MIAGTAANTVIWYTGETGTRSARAPPRPRGSIRSLAVSYGVRANEQACARLVQNIATLAAVPISADRSECRGA